jgi:hypothetical protein
MADDPSPTWTERERRLRIDIAAYDAVRKYGAATDVEAVLARAGIDDATTMERAYAETCLKFQLGGPEAA